MSLQLEVSTYFPDRPPTWAEVVSIGSSTAVVGLNYPSLSTMSWPAVFFGFLTAAIVLCPAANTPLGNRIGQWFQRIGIGGRATVIALILLVIGVVAWFQLISLALIAAVASGWIPAVLLYVVAYVAVAGEVSGWTTDRESTD